MEESTHQSEHSTSGGDTKKDRNPWQMVAAIAAVLTAMGITTGVTIDLLSDSGSDGDAEIGRLTATADDAEIRRLIATEANAVLDGEVESALSIYAQDAVVRDGRGEGGQTLGLIPPDVATTWHGQEEIRHRYETLVRFSELAHTDIIVTLGEDKFASARASTTGKILLDDGTTVTISSIDGEEWRFEKIDGEWKVTSFTYNAR